MPAPKKKPVNTATKRKPARVSLQREKLPPLYYNRDLTPAQMKLVEQYCRTGNIPESNRAAGYNRRHQFLKFPHIREAIQKRLSELFARDRISTERTLNELANIAFVDASRFFDDKGNIIPIQDLPPECSPTIKEFKVRTTADGAVITEVKLHDKMAALTQIGKFLKLFPEMHEHSGPNGKPIEINVEDRRRDLINRIQSLSKDDDGVYSQES